MATDEPNPIIDLNEERRKRRRLAQGFDPVIVDMLDDASARIKEAMNRHPAGKHRKP